MDAFCGADGAGSTVFANGSASGESRRGGALPHPTPLPCLHSHLAVLCYRPASAPKYATQRQNFALPRHRCEPLRPTHATGQDRTGATCCSATCGWLGLDGGDGACAATGLVDGAGAAAAGSCRWHFNSIGTSTGAQELDFAARCLQCFGRVLRLAALALLPTIWRSTRPSGLAQVRYPEAIKRLSVVHRLKP